MRSALARGLALSVGCASGADALVLSSALAVSPASVSLFCVGSSTGAGFWSGSASLSLLRSAAPAGAAVSWWAGGVSSLPLRARLIRRSKSALSGCSCAVFFLASASSHGSLAVAARAARAGLPVFAFSLGFSGPPSALPALSGLGGWSFFSLGVWAWQPAQAVLF
ncbi:MAG TPA: hypothetical protein ENI27_04040 [bacterium]|nr:hypothetical protein [bacterium]